MKQILTLLLTISFSLNCYSGTKTRELYEWCTIYEHVEQNANDMSAEDWIKAGMCDGFFSGLREGEYLQYLVDEVRFKSGKTSEQLNAEFHGLRAWCEPEEGITLEQKVLMFNKYVKEHPESLHKGVFNTLIDAMSPHFPCN